MLYFLALGIVSLFAVTKIFFLCRVAERFVFFFYRQDGQRRKWWWKLREKRKQVRENQEEEEEEEEQKSGKVQNRDETEVKKRAAGEHDDRIQLRHCSFPCYSRDLQWQQQQPWSVGSLQEQRLSTALSVHAKLPRRVAGKKKRRLPTYYKRLAAAATSTVVLTADKMQQKKNMSQII